LEFEMPSSLRMFRSISLACLIVYGSVAVGYWVTSDVFRGLGFGGVIAAMFLLQGIYVAALGGGIPLVLKFVAASTVAFMLTGAAVYALLRVTS
jgi:hypothetical protein